jgi:hypothetical protein
MALAVARIPLPLDTTRGVPGAAAGDPADAADRGVSPPAKSAAAPAPAPVFRKFLLE